MRNSEGNSKSSTMVYRFLFQLIYKHCFLCFVFAKHLLLVCSLWIHIIFVEQSVNQSLPLRTSTGPEGTRRLKVSDFMTVCI